MVFEQSVFASYAYELLSKQAIKLPESVRAM